MKHRLKILCLLFLLSSGCVGLDLERRDSPPGSGKEQNTPSGATPAGEALIKGNSETDLKGRGTVSGRLTEETRRRFAGHLALAKAVKTKLPSVFLLEIEDKNLHLASLTPEGVFTFKEVLPGKYGIIVWNPLSGFPLADPRTKQTLYFDVLPNQVLDLGSVEIPLP